MKADANASKSCRSVFKDGSSETTALQYTRKWTELINLLEKSKTASPERQQ